MLPSCSDLRSVDRVADVNLDVLDVLLGANRLLLAELDQRAAKVNERENWARATLSECEGEREQIDQERAAVLVTDRLYRLRFVQSAESPEVDYRPKTRARIGPQRYRMLSFLKSQSTSNTWSSQAEVAMVTGLGQKRVRDQMRADSADGIVLEKNETYLLSAHGLNLLERYQRYKEARGEPLPPLEGPIGDEEGEDVTTAEEIVG